MLKLGNATYHWVRNLRRLEPLLDAYSVVDHRSESEAPLERLVNDEQRNDRVVNRSHRVGEHESACEVVVDDAIELLKLANEAVEVVRECLTRAMR